MSLRDQVFKTVPLTETIHRFQPHVQTLLQLWYGLTHHQTEKKSRELFKGPEICMIRSTYLYTTSHFSLCMRKTKHVYNIFAHINLYIYIYRQKDNSNTIKYCACQTIGNNFFIVLGFGFWFVVVFFKKLSYLFTRIRRLVFCWSFISFILLRSCLLTYLHHREYPFTEL